MHQSLARWSSDSNNKGTVAVGSYKSNPWGFYDMHGNVWEWCANWYGSYPTGLIIDPSGPVEGFNRVRRGGSWMNPEFLLRSACRFETSPSDGYSYFGFRLCLTEL